MTKQIMYLYFIIIDQITKNIKQQFLNLPEMKSKSFVQRSKESTINIYTGINNKILKRMLLTYNIGENQQLIRKKY
jgi:hypothetical protein